MVVFMLTQPSAQDTKALKKVWQALHQKSCPYNYNFHMHTVHSDGQLKPQVLIEQAVELGLRGMAITDHHSINGYQVAQNWINETRQYHPHKPLPHLWTGVEITANLLDTEIHILGYGFDPQHSLMQPYLQGTHPEDFWASARQVINAFHQAGGLAVLAHPVRYNRSVDELIHFCADLGIDGVEAFYAYGNPKPWTTSPKQTEQVLALSKIYGLFKTCGTDTHGLSLLRRI
ncbi:PHP domain-containing protein [cyanobacterium endosymbiont of Rhopalodia gibberula]|uniref:PHP domain-containing protein n=1 Tax=cyanobacterium endosymbiont of Rhopalodia gibberula TaxID=1763363 RepID=UPI000E646AAA|nr:PHP domain-containing protein [cyanobacterium endosymbiont of Rhopalodia gibberula]